MLSTHKIASVFITLPPEVCSAHYMIISVSITLLAEVCLAHNRQCFHHTPYRCTSVHCILTIDCTLTIYNCVYMHAKHTHVLIACIHTQKLLLVFPSHYLQVCLAHSYSVSTSATLPAEVSLVHHHKPSVFPPC